MQPDPTIQSVAENSPVGGVPPRLRSVPPSVAGPPPLLSPNPAGNFPSVRQLLAILLSLGLGLFLADAVVSVVDDSLIVLFGIHLLAGIRVLFFILATLSAILIYGLIGFMPMIPKRLFLPITLFSPTAALIAIPASIYCYDRLEQVAWVISFCQVLLGLGILYWAAGLKFRWLLVAENQLGVRRFSWRHLSIFLLLNAFVLLPAVVVYLAFCASLAVDHFSDGFLRLRTEGVTVQVRQYVRNDGKSIQLVPMLHVGDADFYRKLSQSFATDAIILTEGVTDTRGLLTNKVSYQRMAAKLGVAEQVKEFKPSRLQMVPADVDVEEFTTNTIELLNLVMLIHAKGMDAGNVVKLLQYSPAPGHEEQLFDDLLHKRNRHLLAEIETHLSNAESVIVPWGAAHMPEIAREIQKFGFRLHETREYVAIRFHSAENNRQNTGKEPGKRE